MFKIDMVLLYVMELLGPLNDKIQILNVHKEILFGIFEEKNEPITTLRKKQGSLLVEEGWTDLYFIWCTHQKVGRDGNDVWDPTIR